MGIRIFSLCIVLIAFIQCKTNTAKKNSEQIADTIASNETTGKDSLSAKDTIFSSQADKDSFSNITFLLPSPDEILAEILADKIEFDPTILNPKNNASKYIDAKHRALNLGIYLTDLAYLNLNDSKNDALEYFKTIRDLAQKINIYSVFTEKMYDRIQNNLTRKDSIKTISKDVYYNMLEALESSKRNNVYALVASGALIEALYISTAVVKNYSDYQPIAQKIFEQKYVLNSFYEFASQFGSDKDVKATLVQFDNFKKILNESGVKTTDKNVTIDKKDHMVIGGGEDVLINEQAFKKFKDNVIKVRKEIISGSR